MAGAYSADNILDIMANVKKGQDMAAYLRQECEDYFGCEYHVALPTQLLPNEMKESNLDVVLEVLECTAIVREPLYCDKCNTVIPSAMIQSTVRCPFCHKEF